MRCLALFSLTILGLCQNLAFAGVWDEMQLGNTTSIEAKILRLNFNNEAIRIDYRTRSGTEGSGQICASSTPPGQAPQAVEIASTHFLLQDLREAVKSSRFVHLAVRGPWNTCLFVMNSQK